MSLGMCGHMPATNQVSDVLPLNRAARSLTSLISLNSLNSLLTARYHDAPKRDEFVVRRASDTTLGEFRGDGLYLDVLPIDEIIRQAAVDDPLSQQRTNYALIIIGINNINTSPACLSSYTGLNTPARVESASSISTVGVSILERISTRNVDLKPMVTG